MNDYVKAWQCIGCGKIEAPQTCIGVCQDRKVEFVYAYEHEEALAQLEVACTNPHRDGWETTYRAMQEQALDAGGHQQCDLSASSVVDAAALTAAERSNLRRRAVLRLDIQIDIALTWSLAGAADAED